MNEARTASEPVVVREEFVEPLRRTLAWLMSLRDARGRIVCPEHGIEHTGKSAGAAVLAAQLARHDPAHREQHIAAAIEQGRRLVANLQREGTSECHTFRPGRHDPYNNSNAIIDGGACSDALAELVLDLGSQMSSDDRAAFARASLLHARTYLRYAVLDKGVPAQRAWGLSGLAAACHLERDAGLDSGLETAAIQAVAALEAVQNADGSFPYHPLEWGAGHIGASDVSAFYHSRIPGFTMFALEQLRRSPADPLFARPIVSALDFLEALQGPDGIKCGLVEAKPWYWGANYEVASHAFDVHALARGAVHFDRERYARAALRAYRAWIAHLAPNGMPRSHHDTPHTRKSYQCPVFWACHTEWIARVLPDLERFATHETTLARGAGLGIDISVRFYPSASLARIEDDLVVAWIRGARPGFNVHHGSPHGAGLLRVVRKRDGADLVVRERLAARQEAEWNGSSGGFAPTRGWSNSRDELRFSLWLARNHARGKRWGEAFAAPFDVLEHGCMDFAAPAVSSAFDIAPEIEVHNDGVCVRSELAHRGGQRAGGTRISREFRVDGEGLKVNELVQERGTVRALDYVVPQSARHVFRDPAHPHVISYRLA